MMEYSCVCVKYTKINSNAYVSGDGDDYVSIAWLESHKFSCQFLLSSTNVSLITCAYLLIPQLLMHFDQGNSGIITNVLLF